jgi:SH3-like domain-containing protein
MFALKRLLPALLILLVTGLWSSAEAQRSRETPYWASISAGRAMMRTGPGRNYPATWLYVRADLPIRVVEIYQNWRKVQDPGGTTGWMMVQLLSDTRTAIVTGDEPRPMQQDAEDSSPIRFRAAPGVVGRVSHCDNGWCLFDVRGKSGYIRIGHIWGVEPGEPVD